MSLTFIDLFAGAGGMSLGLQMAGLRSVGAVEIDPWAAETYRHNFPNEQVAQVDIRCLADQDIEKLFPCTPDLVAGGPPCQGFSQSNIVNHDPKDPRNSLFREFVRAVSVLKPMFALVENVPGLLKSKTASGEPVISVIERSFDEIGYCSKFRLLQAYEYGVPQDRLRLFIIAARSEEALAAFHWPIPTHQLASTEQASMFSTSEAPAITLWDAISDLAGVEDHGTLGPPQSDFQRLMRDGSDTAYNHEAMRHTQRVIERFEAISFGMSEADVPDHLQPRQRGGEGRGRVYSQNSRRQRPDLPCSTVVASSHTNFIHPYLHRNFTVREMLRIQSFPDSFILKGKRAVLSKSLSLKKGYLDDIYLDQRMQVGNAVPPLLAQALGTKIIEAVGTVQGMRHAA